MRRETMRTRQIDPPVPIDASCQHCGGDLIVVGERVHPTMISGLRDLIYHHAHSGKPECTTTHIAKPYDGWRATREYEAAPMRSR
jgi:hypothetical protein